MKTLAEMLADVSEDDLAEALAGAGDTTLAKTMLAVAKAAAILGDSPPRLTGPRLSLQELLASYKGGGVPRDNN